MLEISADRVVEAARALLADGKSGGQESPPHPAGAHG
jgi:hypothetical protein